MTRMGDSTGDYRSIPASHDVRYAEGRRATCVGARYFLHSTITAKPCFPAGPQRVQGQSSRLCRTAFGSKPFVTRATRASHRSPDMSARPRSRGRRLVASLSPLCGATHARRRHEGQRRPPVPKPTILRAQGLAGSARGSPCAASRARIGTEIRYRRGPKRQLVPEYA